MKIYAGITFVVISLFSCFFTSTAQLLFPYQFHAPDAVWELDDELKEISGLSTSRDGQQLVAVQDEEGIIYFLDKKDGSILRKVSFWDDGDYEGIEMVGKDVFVIKSTGTVYWVKEAESQEPVTEKFNYDLNKDNDVEGLGYDPVGNRLLLACKAHPDGRKDARGIYSFRLGDMHLTQDPAFTLTLDAVHQYLSKHPEIPRYDKVKSFFDEDELDFSPSALAVHPNSGDLYLLSSKGKMIIVMNRKNEIVYIQKLQKEEHPQPEGLCFDREGNLYISNEGKDGKATILVYRHRPN
ncbi:MAG: SdiA-regulated domain-containing protein [Saprospiraceae bacterium]|nr:SdiA-regulated domain-containing protein [Lewinella sp.]